MNFGANDYAITQAHVGISFPLAPPPPSVEFPEARQIPNARACRNRFDTNNLANEFELHIHILSKMATDSNQRNQKTGFAAQCPITSVIAPPYPRLGLAGTSDA